VCEFWGMEHVGRWICDVRHRGIMWSVKLGGQLAVRVWLVLKGTGDWCGFGHLRWDVEMVRYLHVCDALVMGIGVGLGAGGCRVGVRWSICCRVNVWSGSAVFVLEGRVGLGSDWVDGA